MVSVLRYETNGNPLDSLSQDLADGHARKRNASRPSRARSRVELSLLRDRSLTARFALGLIATCKVHTSVFVQQELLLCRILKVDTKYQLADPLTKPVDRACCESFRTFMNGETRYPETTIIYS